MPEDSGLNILLIEDSDDHAELVRRAFARSRDAFNLVRAASCSEAAEVIKDMCPSVIICDYLLPDGNGLHLYKNHLKAGCPDAPVLLLTSQGDELVAVDALKSGMTDYLVKSDQVLISLPDMCRSIIRENDQKLENRKHVEALLKSEELYRGILHAAIDGFWLADRQNRLIEVNDAYCRMSGYSEQELLALSIADLEANMTADDVAVQTQKIIEQGEARFSSRHRRKDGTFFDVEISVKYQPVDGKTVVFLRDISERMLAEEKLRLTQFSIDKSSDGIFWMTPDARIVDVNESACSSLGYSREELLRLTVPDIDPFYNIEVWQQSVAELKKHLSQTFETVHSTKGGTQFPVEIVSNLIQFGNRELICASVRNITERKQIDDVQSYLLQISSLCIDEDFFELLARYLANILGMDYVCIDTLHGDSLSARTLAIYNDGRIEDNVEYTLKDTPCGDVVGKDVCVFPKGVRSLFPQDLALQDLQAESYVGTTLWSLDMKPIGLIAVIGRKELNSSHFAETVLKLVSVRAAAELERRRAEEEKQAFELQLQHTQKLESLGVLSGGIAHDFNNILAIIMGYCSLTKMDYETAEQNIQEIEKAAERAAGLCRQMLAYAGKAQLSMTQVNMCMLVDELVKMLQATLPQNAVIKTDISGDTPYITADAVQIRQIVMNLIINASEAIGKEQGEISVLLTRRTVTAGPAEMDYHGKNIPAGNYVCLEVTDSGCGMDEETKWRIFEPFYTTKFTGRGLGMSAVLGIINSHSGSLQLFSQPGKGTTFKVYLPVQGNGSPGEEGRTALTPPPLWQGSGTILLVEDETQIRHITKTVLANFGFTVLEAANGKEALELYRQNAAEIRLVLTDLGMPVMDGYALFHALKQINPDLPIIVSSGFGEGDIGSKIPMDNIAGLINKPYNPGQLREVLKSVVSA